MKYILFDVPLMFNSFRFVDDVEFDTEDTSPFPRTVIALGFMIKGKSINYDVPATLYVTNIKQSIEILPGVNVHHYPKLAAAYYTWIGERQNDG